MAVLAPTPRAIVRTAVTVNTGLFRKMRTATIRSWKSIGLRHLAKRSECRDSKFKISNLKFKISCPYRWFSWDLGQWADRSPAWEADGRGRKAGLRAQEWDRRGSPSATAGARCHPRNT